MGNTFCTLFITAPLSIYALFAIYPFSPGQVSRIEKYVRFLLGQNLFHVLHNNFLGFNVLLIFFASQDALEVMSVTD